MTIADFGNVEATLALWMVAMLRPGAAMLAAPIFGAANVPLQLRLVLALAVGLPAAGNASIALPPEGLASLPGMLLMLAELVAGLAMGFAVQLGFAAALLAGEAISNMMGIGFAAMADPASCQPSPAIGQYLSMLATFLFLASDGHLAFAAIILESYQSLPPGSAWISANALGGLVEFGGLVFAAGLTVAMPVLGALLLVQAALAMIARSAPTLNLFSVGLPATLIAGVILLAIATPVMADTLLRAISDALDQARLLGHG
jgi:flagellar biosynthesis protein FliR